MSPGYGENGSLESALREISTRSFSPTKWPISEEQEEALATVGITAVGGKDMARKQRLRSVHPLYRQIYIGQLWWDIRSCCTSPTRAHIAPLNRRTISIMPLAPVPKALKLSAPISYTDFPRTLIRALRQGFHKLMHSSLVIVTLGHGPFFSESADALSRKADLASFLLHHSSSERSESSPYKKGYPFKICHPNQLGLHFWIPSTGSMSITWDITANQISR